MDDKPGTSRDTNEQQQKDFVKNWTRELKSLPTINL